jgi:hypothetical protein
LSGCGGSLFDGWLQSVYIQLSDNANTGQELTIHIEIEGWKDVDATGTLTTSFLAVLPYQ